MFKLAYVSCSVERIVSVTACRILELQNQNEKPTFEDVEVRRDTRSSVRAPSLTICVIFTRTFAFMSKLQARER
jgi:hypothetical protein